MTGPQQTDPVFQLKVTLKNIEPPIWRQFLAPSGITLHRLHLILQEVMGWENYHLYRFQIGRRDYGEPHPDNDFYELNFRNSKRAKLGRLVKTPGDSFSYEYDFGDSWIHQLLLEDIVQAETGRPYPVCLEGSRACPPEDCGGSWGYGELLEVIRNPAHEEYLDRLEWLGEGFDPEHFDIEQVNLRLARMR
ncbi:MAG: plasmid pRiA4b ORF-3 family protein [Dehalococcoidia bacterium]